MVYTKNEMAKRCAIIYSASAISGAFGGLGAYGLIWIPFWTEWRWLFTIEGALTVCLVPFPLILFPNELTMAWWLNEDKKEVFKMRLQYYPDCFFTMKSSPGLRS
jgi:MFS family permease